MSQSGTYGSGGGGGGTVETLTGNTGGAVGPDGMNNINVVGSGDITVTGNAATNTLTISSSVTPPGFLEGNTGGEVGPNGSNIIFVEGDTTTSTVVGNPGTNTLTITTLNGASRYVVSSVSGEAAYTSIQTAINQAVSDGASASTPAVVWIWDGLYSASLTLHDYVSLAAADSNVHITGTATYGGTGEISLVNISMKSTGGTAALLVTSTGTVNITGGTFTASGAPAISMTGAGAINAFATQIGATSTGRSINLTNGTCTVTGSTVSSSSSNGIEIASYGNLIFEGCQVNDFFILLGGIAHVYNCNVYSGSNYSFDLGIGSAAYVFNSSISSSGSNFFVIGSGTFTYGNITAIGTATQINSGNTVVGEIGYNGNLSFDGGYTTLSDLGDIWVSNGTNPVVFGVGSNGQVLTANSGQPEGVEWANPGFVKIPFTDEISSFNAVSNNGYFVIPAGPLNATLPSSPSQGDMIIVTVDGSSTAVVANTGQYIRVGANKSSSGGTASSTAQGDSLTLVYRAADTTWISISTMGNWTLA